MGNLAEVSQWESGIYQLETTDEVKGGPDGIDNVPLKQLGNRTAWLKAIIDKVIEAAGLVPDAADLEQLREAMHALVGTGQAFIHFGETPPPGALEIDGATLSRATHSRLWNCVNTAGNGFTLIDDSEWLAGRIGCFSRGDGATTFRIPDFRGEFLRAWDNGRGIDIGRLLGSFQDHALEYHNHYIPTSGGSGVYDLPGITDAYWDLTPGNNISPSAGIPAVTDQDGASLYGQNGGNRAGETRSRNIAVMFCIKY